jgi:trans-aconitate 2-methyltransferase
MSANRGRDDKPYLFGDSDLAAERLRLLAEVFAASTRAFLEPFVAQDPRQILDLGCGPGYTTRLLAEVFPSAEVRGFDSSEHFIGIARQVPHERVSYAVADVTQPLPGGPYDLIYCRYLLTHLTQAESVIAAWAAHLRPTALLAIEENDWIHTEEPALARYLAIAEALLAAAGNRLYIGAELERAAHGQSVVKKSSELVPIAVSNRDAARMFLMNLHGWRNQAPTSPARRFVEQNYRASELDQLRRNLESLSNDPPQRSSITFGRRRLVYGFRTNRI